MRLKKKARQKAIQLKKNEAKLEEEQRRINIQQREKAVKNAKISFKRSLATLKLTPQQRNALMSRVTNVKNIDNIFEEARAMKSANI